MERIPFSRPKLSTPDPDYPGNFMEHPFLLAFLG